jgi:hypothetical protein
VWIRGQLRGSPRLSRTLSPIPLPKGQSSSRAATVWRGPRWADRSPTGRFGGRPGTWGSSLLAGDTCACGGLKPRKRGCGFQPRFGGTDVPPLGTSYPPPFPCTPIAPIRLRTGQPIGPTCRASVCARARPQIRGPLGPVSNRSRRGGCPPHPRLEYPRWKARCPTPRRKAPRSRRRCPWFPRRRGTGERGPPFRATKGPRTDFRGPWSAPPTGPSTRPNPFRFLPSRPCSHPIPLRPTASAPDPQPFAFPPAATNPFTQIAPFWPGFLGAYRPVANDGNGAPRRRPRV